MLVTCDGGVNVYTHKSIDHSCYNPMHSYNATHISLPLSAIILSSVASFHPQVTVELHHCHKLQKKHNHYQEL